MFEHPEHTKMTFRIKFNTVNMDNISYHDNKLETGKTGEIKENGTNFTTLVLQKTQKKIIAKYESGWL